jgi:cell division transport system permease protein
MRYIGATNAFILAPFLIEGVIIGVVAALIAFFIEWYIYRFMMLSVLNEIPEVSVVEFSEISSVVLFSFICAGIVSGLIGSALSARKYLKA